MQTFFSDYEHQCYRSFARKEHFALKPTNSKHITNHILNVTVLNTFQAQHVVCPLLQIKQQACLHNLRVWMCACVRGKEETFEYG